MTDLSSRFAALPPEKQQLLKRLLKKDQRFDALQGQLNEEADEPGQYDVVVLGGGLAGLTLAIQIKQARPNTSILLAEKNAFPLSESRLKVGESTLEIGSRYFDTIIGMKQHLDTEQLPKLGLRFFFTADDNQDIAKRVELGSFQFLWHPSYQLNRARFENALAAKAVKLGVAIQDNCRVREVTFGPELHTVDLEIDSQPLTVKTRWVADATGRGAFLRRKLNLTQQVGHDANSVWLHVAEEVDIGTWSDDPDWLGLIKPGFRRFSTNHLLGHGYWVWLIPLATGSTSIGIVADAKLHPLNELNTFDKAMEWLWRYEPQVAEAVEKRLDIVEDFRVQRHFAHGCKQAFSGDRFCLTGEAAVFTDPLYSLGSDFIGMANTFITDLVTRELDGEDIGARLELFNWFFLKTWFQIGIAIYEDNYPLMDNTPVMLAKVLWDSGIYWAYFGAIFFHNKLTDYDFMYDKREEIQKVMDLTLRLQAFFRQWNQLDKQERHHKTIDWSGIQFLYDLHWGMGVGLDDEALKAKLTENLALMETVAAEMFYYATRFLPDVPHDRAINPYAITLDRERWEKDGLFLPEVRKPLPPHLAADLKRIWFDDAPVMAEMPVYS